jgi:hypothetical protein
MMARAGVKVAISNLAIHQPAQVEIIVEVGLEITPGRW